MERETLLLLTLGMFIAAALAVGVCGWMLFVRDRRLVKAGHATAGDGAHHEAAEER